MSPYTLATSSTAVGLWQSIDDKSGKPRSLIRINQVGGEYQAEIEKLLAEDSTNKVCTKCTDDRKDQPIIGMTIAQGLKQSGNQYSGGKILDPENGKVYHCKMKLSETGDELTVRGFIGFSLLGRSQTWTRVE